MDNNCHSGKRSSKPKPAIQHSPYHASQNSFNKTLIAGSIFLAINTAHAADACDYVSTTPETSCVYIDNKINIHIHTDINNTNNTPAYEYETDYATTDKSVINLEAGTTINSAATGIQSLGYDNTEIEVSTSGNIYTGKTTDIDAQDPQAPISGPSGGIIYENTNVRETQHASIYLAGASGGLLALGAVIQNSDSQIINKSNSKDTAAIYSQALESRVTTSGVIRSQVGDAVRLQDTGPQYSYSSGGYIILDPQSIFDVHLQAGSHVEGGSEGSGIKTIGGATSNITIDEGAMLDALSDVAISATGYDYYDLNYTNNPSGINTYQYSGAATSITNAGTLTGVIQLTSGQDNIVNDTTGVWNIRQWSDTDRDGVRDTIASVATSDFGGGTTELENRGQIVLTANIDGSANSALLQNLHTFKNQGRLILANNVVGDRFTIDGDYVGNNGTIELDTYLGDDTSLTDRVIINGSTSGKSYLVVDNLGGTGAKTSEGIKVIEINGDSTGDFIQQGRIVGGAHEYYLHKNGVNNQDGDWYLRSKLPVIISEVPGLNPDPEPEPKPDPSPIPTPDPVPTPVPVPDPDPKPVPAPENINRPEPGSYMFNHMAANSLFLMRLHDRMGETQYTDALTGEQKVTSLWLRQVGGLNRSRDVSGQLKNKGNRYVTQIGGDVAQWSSNGFDRWHLGVMAGYARQTGKTESQYSGYQSRSSVEGYSAGFYGTWYANEEDKTGSYLDTWALYNWFDNEVKGDQLATEKYKSRGITASFEAGYTFKLGEKISDGVKYYLQPKGQLTWMNVRANDHIEHPSSGSSRVSFEGNGNIQSRIGIRAYANGHSYRDKGKDRNFQPFIEANWVHNTHNFGATMNGYSDNIDGTQNICEVKIGLEGQLSHHLDVWGNVAQQIGYSGYSDTVAILGVKYRF
ncbi:autotransporter outer membrane beta-barrel domain-containing protein [Escherichia sp. E4385]|uniref:autotransporter outer membrane beta-barrel domain-containing protein n=1 Tax=Escherichia sp. E4385 TaxID=2040639 RepID=UPI001F0DB3A5|nr:autotransporter outer membrane beta-barrel domain-containing protein [Escherichia sp. E4385]